MSRFAALLVLAALQVACATEEAPFLDPDPERIDRADVERVLNTLADDDMRGRRAFTDDALRAADFLAREFASAGLHPLEGTEGYLQRFVVRSITTTEVEASINGAAIPQDRLGARLGGASLSWSTGDVEVVVVGPDADPRSAMLGALQGGSDAFVVLDEVHADEFQRFSRFFRSPVRVVGDARGPNVILAVANAAPGAAFEIRASATVSEEGLVNVVGMIPGRRPEEFVLFSAHYDHLGIRPAVDGDSIANGANDDASGTAAVVALAKYYASRGTPERTLLFAAFTAEEGGGYGSRHFAAQLNPDHVVAMFNIEMIGKPAVEGPNTAWITGFERSSFGPLLQAAVAGTGYAFYADPYPDQNLFYRSDNATLARLGVPAHSISTTPIDVDGDYHAVTDQVETLDLDHLTNTVRAIAMGAETIISGAATPTRVDPGTVD